MWKPRCLPLLAAVASLLLVATSGRGQDWGGLDNPSYRPSHIEIPGGTSADAEHLLSSRLKLSKNNAELEKLAADVIRNPGKYNLKPEDLQKLAARHAVSGKPPPEVKKAVEEALRGRAPTTPDASREETRRIGDELRNIANRPSDPEPSSRRPSPAMPPEMTPNPPTGNTVPQQGNGTMPALRPVPPAVSTQAENNSRWLRSFTDSLGNSPLTDSESLRSFVGALAESQRVGAPPTEDRKFGDSPLEKSFARLGGHLPDNVNLPDMKWSARRADLRAPSGRATADLDGGSLGTVALSVFLAALCVLAAWGLWRFGLPKRWSRAATTEALGPWPVSPNAVHTRAELICAFEYLAVLLLGRAARSRNHLDIAAGLVHQEPDRRDAADRLAHAYEQARYAPPDEPLSEGELLAARRDLCLLAGAAAV